MSGERYTHIWASETLGYDPEGYLRGQINKQWVNYDYAHESNSTDKPDVYSHIHYLQYLGFLDKDSPIDCSHRIFLDD